MLYKLTQRFLWILLLMGFIGTLSAQRTVGVTHFDETEAMPGYNLYFPHNQPNVYLFDNCGRVVHQWNDDANWRPGNTAYIMPNGNLVKAKRDASIAGDPIWAGGGGETVEIRDWDNNLLWTFTMNDSVQRLHHDIAPMPNGNVLMIAWELKTKAEAIAAGRDTALLPENELWPEKVIEVKPIGADSFEIVWEWHAWDHMVQDFDMSKDNYGDPSAHPELIDINFLGNSGGNADWHHANAIDYNEELDQVILSIPTFNEIWIIDHSTTTAQASSHMGGASKKGGDLMYRWGNPMAYRRGDSADIQLGYQHGIHWIGRFLDPLQADVGKLMLFNNRIGDNFSTVDMLDPGFDDYEWEYPLSDNVFLPASPSWTYMAPTPEDMYSNILSSAQRLQNGNTLICVGRPGRSFEINENEEIVWEFVNPIERGNALSQGDTIPQGANIFTFRMDRYPVNYAGFQGRTLIPGDFLEMNPDTAWCTLNTAIDPRADLPTLSIYPNPAKDFLYIKSSTAQPATVALYDVHGKQVKSMPTTGRKTQMNVVDMPSGIYIIRIDGHVAGKVMIEN